jgi:predicted RNase H-like nuclease (RuvC/YqgF family)
MADQPTRNEEQAIQEQNEINQGTTTTITARVPYHLKARLYDLSERSKINLSAYVATRLYKYVQGEIVDADQVPDRTEEVEQLQQQLESESSLHKQAVQDAEEYRKERDRLQKKLEEHGQRPTQNHVEKLQKQLEEYKQRPTQNQYDKLQKQLEEYKQRPTLNQYDKLENELDNANTKIDKLTNQLEEIEERLEAANQWIGSNTGGFLGLEYPGEF